MFTQSHHLTLCNMPMKVILWSTHPCTLNVTMNKLNPLHYIFGSFFLHTIALSGWCTKYRCVHCTAMTRKVQYRIAQTQTH